jgi:hypothetical protein
VVLSRTGSLIKAKIPNIMGFLMSEDTVSEVGKFLLPFAVLSERRIKPFTSDMELAAVFSVAELGRRKGGRMILRRSKENIAFLSKVGYPLWLFPFSKSVLVFDGQCLSEYSLPYAQISNVKTFLESLKTSSKTCDVYLTFLADHSDYFAKSAGEQNLPLKSLITDAEFLSEVSLYLLEATKMDEQPEYVGLLPSAVDESRLFNITNEMASLRTAFEEDLKSLSASTQLLGNATQAFLRDLNDEVKAVKEEFAAKIREEEAIVTPKVADLREQYNLKTAKLAKDIEQQKLPLHTEKLKLEKAKEETRDKISELNINAQVVAENDDALVREKWKQELKDAKQELSELGDRLKNKEKAIEDLERKRSSMALELKSELEKGIKEARKNLVELAASRDAKVLVIRQGITELEKRSKLISDQIGRVVKLREANIAQFEKLSVNPHSKELNKAIVYVPFYLVCYNSEGNKRYVVLPPSFVGSIHITTKLRGALGRARIKSFLVPRFREMTFLAKHIKEECEKNSTFEMELSELGVRNNILALKSTQKEIEKGLLNLKDQGWLSDKDYGKIVAHAKTDLNIEV